MENGEFLLIVNNSCYKCTVKHLGLEWEKRHQISMIDVHLGHSGH